METLTITLTRAEAELIEYAASSFAGSSPSSWTGAEVEGLIAASAVMYRQLFGHRPHTAASISQSSGLSLATIGDRAKKRRLGVLVHGVRHFSGEEAEALLAAGTVGRRRKVTA